jgi:hypothetical protein
MGYSFWQNPTLGISFTYPEAWSVEIDCGHSSATASAQAGSCTVILTPPDTADESKECVPDEPMRTTRVYVGGKPSYQVSPDVCSRRLEGSPLFGSIYDTGEKTYTSCGYAGWGDGAEACVTDGHGKHAIIHMSPPAGSQDRELNQIVRSFRFLRGGEG